MLMFQSSSLQQNERKWKSGVSGLIRLVWFLSQHDNDYKSISVIPNHFFKYSFNQGFTVRNIHFKPCPDITFRPAGVNVLSVEMQCNSLWESLGGLLPLAGRATCLSSMKEPTCVESHVRLHNSGWLWQFHVSYAVLDFETWFQSQMFHVKMQYKS